jgi:hypothetical protein
MPKPAEPTVGARRGSPPAGSSDLSPVAAATGLTCEDVTDLLPGITDGGTSPSDSVRAHVETCLRCQAEVARYRRVLRALRSLGAEVVEPDPGGLAAVLAGLEAAGRARVARSLVTARRAAYLGGVVVATAASAAGVLVWATRRRPDIAC